MNDAKEYGQRVAEAFVAVVENARWEAHIGSIRELARRSGMTHTALNSRMTGTTIFTVRDLAAISIAVEVSAVELVRRAKEIADGPPLKISSRAKTLGSPSIQTTRGHK